MKEKVNRLKAVSLMLPQGTWERVKGLAAERGESAATLVREALRRYLEERRKG